MMNTVVLISSPIVGTVVKEKIRVKRRVLKIGTVFGEEDYMRRLNEWKKS